MDKIEFNKLSTKEKFKLLKKSANYIGARTYGSYFVHLFEFNGYFVEGWRDIGTVGYRWIEVVNNDESLQEYLSNINLNYKK